jgi:hypothetical protein
LILVRIFAIVTAASSNDMRETNVTIQPEKRYLIAWTVLAALVVTLVIAINLVVRVQAI